jgi:hypothetical protein
VRLPLSNNRKQFLNDQRSHRRILFGHKELVADVAARALYSGCWQKGDAYRSASALEPNTKTQRCSLTDPCKVLLAAGENFPKALEDHRATITSHST